MLLLVVLVDAIFRYNSVKFIQSFFYCYDQERLTHINVGTFPATY